MTAHLAEGPDHAASAKDVQSDDEMLDRLQRTAFDYFLQCTNPDNGLVADTTRDGAPSSIAVVGFALSATPIGVEHGWIERSDAVKRVLASLNFFMASDQSGSAGATGYHGFYFHFLDMKRGTRVWRCELSPIDTTILIAGMLSAGAYFDADTPEETELRRLADALYERVDWLWMQNDGVTVMQGWKPECGFLHYGWEGYSEALLLYALGLGSPTHALTEQSFHAWTMTYQWEHLYGTDFLYAGPLFIHQFSHAWIDFRGIRDAFMREKDCDYFENSRRATYIQRAYAILNPRSFVGYDAEHWGLSAGDGPSGDTRQVAGRQQTFYGYAARGVPYGPDDGTVSGSSITSSLVFAPEIVLPALRALQADGTAQDRDFIHASGFNATLGHSPGKAWTTTDIFGLDQGMIVLMIENYRSGLPWRLMKRLPCIRDGLHRASFRGSWLKHRSGAHP